MEKQEIHKKYAIDLFNLVWDLIEKKDRTSEENDKMIHAAHASRFHWGEIGTPVEFERGEWQISRVYSVLERSEPAIIHAQRCLDICLKNQIKDFDIAFAYEALARAHAVDNNIEKSNEFIQLADEAGRQIKEKENRDYFFTELNTIPELNQ